MNSYKVKIQKLNKVSKKEIYQLILNEIKKVFKVKKIRFPITIISINRLVNKYLKIEEESMKLLTSNMNSCKV